MFKAFTFVAVLLFGLGQLPLVAQSGKEGPTLIGTWQTSVTPRNCSTGTPFATAFPGILTFNQGGTMTGTSTALTSVYGVWKRQPGRHEYSFSSISLRYTAEGVFLGTKKIVQNVTIGDNSDTFTSTGEFIDTDASGATVAAGCSSSTGIRFAP